MRVDSKVCFPNYGGRILFCRKTFMDSLRPRYVTPNFFFFFFCQIRDFKRTRFISLEKLIGK